MASPAQQIANAANAQFSTGPQTAEGKAKASKNATTHGLATGVLHIPEAEIEAFHQFEANLKAAARPQGALERETCAQLVYAAWRLRRVQSLMQALYQTHQADPLVTAQAAPQLRQLSRYRAALEMTFFRAYKQLRELQTRRAGRFLQLSEPERDLFPKQINPTVYTAIPQTKGDRLCRLAMSGLLGEWAQWRVELDENYLPIFPLRPIPRE